MWRCFLETPLQINSQNVKRSPPQQTTWCPPGCPGKAEEIQTRIHIKLSQRREREVRGELASVPAVVARARHRWDREQRALWRLTGGGGSMAAKNSGGVGCAPPSPLRQRSAHESATTDMIAVHDWKRTAGVTFPCQDAQLYQDLRHLFPRLVVLWQGLMKRQWD
jgi:hypothetical protein